jgi:uncharacterized protein
MPARLRALWLLLTAQLFTAALLVAGAAAAAAPPPAPTERVTDLAGVMSHAERDDLESRLAAYERESGHQLVVWIGRTSGDDTVENFAVRAFEAWKLGRAGVDDGLALFVLVDDRKVRLEVGYGLEDRVTDLVAAQIIRDVIVPPLVAGDFDTAIRSGVESTVDAIEGRAGALPAGATGSRAPPPASDPGGWGSGLLMGLLGLGFVILLFTRPQLALLLLWSMSGHGRRGGGIGGLSGGFSGGFSGGGGRSGGGGATGSW